MSRVYIESNKQLRLMTMGLNRAAKPRSWVLDELSKSLKQIKAIRSYYRNGDHEEQNSWDCGRQDSFGDRIDHAYFEYNSLRLAYKIQKGDATLLKQIFSYSIGVK